MKEIKIENSKDVTDEFLEVASAIESEQKPLSAFFPTPDVTTVLPTPIIKPAEVEPQKIHTFADAFKNEPVKNPLNPTGAPPPESKPVPTLQDESGKTEEQVQFEMMYNASKSMVVGFDMLGQILVMKTRSKESANSIALEQAEMETLTKSLIPVVQKYATKALIQPEWAFLLTALAIYGGKIFIMFEEEKVREEAKKKAAAENKPEPKPKLKRKTSVKFAGTDKPKGEKKPTTIKKLDENDEGGI